MLKGFNIRAIVSDVPLMYGSETVVSSFFVSVFAHTSFFLSCLYLLVSISSSL